MANSFSNRKKLQLIASIVEDGMKYIKGSKSYFPQSEMKGKKYGMKVTGYLADPGVAVDGIVADPKDINEPEINAYLNNKNSSCEVDLWDEFTNIEDWTKEVALKRAQNIAMTAQKEIMGEQMFASAQCVVKTSAGFGLLTDAASKLDELSVGGEKLSFQTPTIMGAIAESGLARFLPSDKMKAVFEDAYLGQYAGAAQIEIANCPIVDTTNMDSAPTISADVVKDGATILGVEAITTITPANSAKIVAGMPYKLSGLKIVNAAGIETDQDYIVIPHEENRGGTKVLIIPELRITAPGKGTNNPNAVLAAATISAALSGDTATFTLTPVLTASKKYAVGQCRSKEALGFDQYRFENLPGSDSQDVGTFENITLKLMSFGDGKNGVKLVRIDFPYVAKIFDHRESVSTYTEIA